MTTVTRGGNIHIGTHRVRQDLGGLGPDIAVVPIGEGTAPPPPPSMEVLYQVSTERAELYICKPPEGLRVPLLVQLEEI